MARVTVREASPAGPDFTDRIVFGCVFLTGAVGLACGVAWITRAARSFGSLSDGLRAVVIAALLGLALGSAVLARASTRASRPLTLLGKLHFALGGLVLLSPSLFLLGELIHGAAYPALRDRPELLFLCRVIAAAPAVAPAAFALGAVLPLVLRQYLVRRETFVRSVGRWIGIHTLGAGVGAFVASTLLVPSLGTSGTVYVSGALSLAIGFVVLAFADDKRAPLAESGGASAPSSGEEGGASPARSGSRSAVVPLFSLCGGVLLAEVLLANRFLTLLASTTASTDAHVLSLVLLGLGAGAFIGASLRLGERSAFVLGGLQVLTGLFFASVFFLSAEWWRENLVGDASQVGLQLCLLVFLVPALCAGFSFPLACGLVTDSTRHASAAVGNLRAGYAFGGALGTWLVGSLLLPSFGLESSLKAAAVASVVLGAAVWILVDGAGGRVRELFLAAIALAAVYLLPGLGGARLPVDHLVSEGDEVVHVHEGRDANLAVLQRGDVRRLEIDRVWRGEGRKNHQVMAAHLPMLLHRSPGDVMVVGLGVGETARRFLDYDIERLDCVESVDGWEDAVRASFESGWLEDPRVTTWTADGRSLLRYGEMDYDVIAVQLGQAFRAGVEAYYSREFYEEACEALREGGLLCQFVPLLFVDTDECAGLIHTFLEVFPDASLWFDSGQLLLVGAKNSPFRIPAERLELTRSNPRVNEDLEWSSWGGPREHLNSPAGFLGSFLMGRSELRRLSSGGEVYHDDPPAFDAAVTAGTNPRAEVLIAELVGRYTPSVADCLDDAGSLTQDDLDHIEDLRRGNLSELRLASVGRAGYQAFLGGEYDEARDLLRRALGVNSRNVPLRLYLGDVQQALGRRADALREYRTALGVDPGRIGTHQRLVAAYEADGRDNLALRHLERLYELQPDELAVALAYGRAVLDAGDAPDALAILEPHAQAADAELHFQLGRAYNGQRNIEKTRRAYLRCIELDASRVEARVNLGNSYRDSGRLSEAIQEYEHAIRTRPSLATAHYNLSVALSRDERIDEAIEAGERALQVKGDFYPMYDHLGTLYYRKGSYRQAVQMYERALEIKPDFANARTNLARAKAKLGDG